MKKLITFFLILSFYYPLNSYSQSFIPDGNTFLETCKGSYEKCQGYLQGINDTVQAFRFWGKLDDCYFKLPSNVTDIQLVELIIKHYENNPQYKEGFGANIIINKLFETFPCIEDDIQSRIERLLKRLEFLLIYKEIHNK